MEKQKTILLYQKLSKLLDTVEAIMSKITLHEISQRSDYLETQLEELDDFDVRLNVALYLPDDALHIFQELLKIGLNIQEQNKTKFYHKNQFYKEV